MIARHPSAPERLTRRPITPGDEPFLFTLYASTREQELAQVLWAPGMKELFLRQQFQAQQTHYQSYFPTGEHELILHGGEPVGRIYVERSEAKIHLLDIALLPAWRGQGIGDALMRELLEEAAQRGLPVTLHVYSPDTAVLSWYERLGFARIGGNELYHLMEWRPTGSGGA